MLKEDLQIREFLEKRLSNAGVSRIVIERPAKKARVMIYSARPGVVIGKKGEAIEVLRREVAQRCSADVHLNIVEVRKPELDAKLIAESIAQQLVRRVTFRRAMKRAVQAAMRLGALGIRVGLLWTVGRSRDRAGRVVPRRARAVAHAAGQHRLCQGDSAHAVRHQRDQGVGIPRRDHGARSVSVRSADGRCVAGAGLRSNHAAA